MKDPSGEFISKVKVIPDICLTRFFGWLTVLFILQTSSIYAGQSSAVNLPAVEEAPVTIVPRPKPQAKGVSGDIRVDVSVVLVPVTVTDRTGNPVLGLPAETFHVTEDGVEQPIARVTRQDAPLSIGLVFDASKSMENKLDRSREAIAEILRTSETGDEYFLVGFNDKPALLCGFTPETKQIETALMSVRPIGWTALLDAIHLSVSRMKRAKNSRRALVVLSDGGDNNSRFTRHEVRDLLRESDLSLYAIGITGPMVPVGAMKMLSSLAEETGGRLFPVHGVKQLPEAVDKLNKALRDQYLVAYYPTNSTRDGKYRHIQVRLATPSNSPALRASWRSGYYAPY
jgi:Ca-activated chloride channel family protein